MMLLTVYYWSVVTWLLVCPAVRRSQSAQFVDNIFQELLKFLKHSIFSVIYCFCFRMVRASCINQHFWIDNLYGYIFIHLQFQVLKWLSSNSNISLLEALYRINYILLHSVGMITILYLMTLIRPHVQTCDKLQCSWWSCLRVFFVCVCAFFIWIVW